MKNLTTILIWMAVVAAIFGVLWWKGYFQRLSAYCRQTIEELKKCTWPTWDELKGSTVVVMVSMLLLGVFTFIVDQILFALFKLI